MKQLNDLIADFWRDYSALVLLAAGLLGVVLLIALGVWAKRSKKPLRPIALAFSMNLALLLNAEGMWVIAIDQLKLPAIFAVLVFAVFEICFLTATSLAAEQYRRTSVYAPDGTVVTPGHPGPMLWIAALIAGLSGIIVASNAVTFTEKLLRLAVPCMIFLMWWAALTAAGQRVRRGRFAYSPRRLAERWGLLIPDDDPDLVRMAADRQTRRMVVNYHRVSAGRFPKSWWRNRLLKDARTAGEPVVEDVIEQLARIQRVMDLLVPGAVRLSVPSRPESLRAAADPLTAGQPVAAGGAVAAGQAVTTGYPGAVDQTVSASRPGASGQAVTAGQPVAAPSPQSALAAATEPVPAGSQAQAVQFVEPVRFMQPSEPQTDTTLPVVRVSQSPAPTAPDTAFAGAAVAPGASTDGFVPAAVNGQAPSAVNGQIPVAASSVPGQVPSADAAQAQSTATGPVPAGGSLPTGAAGQGSMTTGQDHANGSGPIPAAAQGGSASTGLVSGAAATSVTGDGYAVPGRTGSADNGPASAFGNVPGLSPGNGPALLPGNDPASLPGDAPVSSFGNGPASASGAGSASAGATGFAPAPGQGSAPRSAGGPAGQAADGFVGAGDFAPTGSGVSGSGGPVAAVPMQRSGDGLTVPVPAASGPAPAQPAIPAWASTGTGARPAVSIAGSPWWRLAVDRLSKMVAQEITPEDLPEMNYLRINELARRLAPRVSELGEGVVRTFIGEYVRELDGEHVESAYPWRDFLPAPAAAKPGSEAWFSALTDLRTALEEELGEGQPMDPDELSGILAPSAPRLDERTVRAFIGDYVLALSGMSAAGAGQPWAELMPRPQSARPASDEELLEMHGAELFEHLRSTGKLSRYKVQAVTGIKSRVQADRIKVTIEERAAETATA
ncbi:MFS transporter [Actinoplanes sp. G11-F43]|uniref:MFS transporter n=1 Tax=Actinoplanes sp. G11-F43 TaxID=3424130 RepID=UPI003D34F80C